MNEMRVLAPTGVLGSGLLEASFEAALAIKASIPRSPPQGDLGDAGGHGGQQYAPLMPFPSDYPGIAQEQDQRLRKCRWERHKIGVDEVQQEKSTLKIMVLRLGFCRNYARQNP